MNMVGELVLKIEMEGFTTSFRYPYFTTGYQPTFDLPPPSTIYGHICSAVGDYVNTTGLEFAYCFQHKGKFVDYREHLHFHDPIQPLPSDRELLFRPHLILYLRYPDLNYLYQAFSHPRYAVVLGRSQDLMRYTSIQLMQLEQRTEGYFEGTLLPITIAPMLDATTITVQMPRYIDPQRRVYSEAYSLLTTRSPYPPRIHPMGEDDFWSDDETPFVFEGYDVPKTVWVDPNSPPHPKYSHLQRALYFHTFMQKEMA